MNTRFTDTEVLQKCLTFITELNGIVWQNMEPYTFVKADMELRARALQDILYNQLRTDGKLVFHYIPERIDYIRAFTVDCYMGVVYDHPEGYAVQVKDLYANRWLTAGPTIWPKDKLNEAIKDAAQRVGFDNPKLEIEK